MDLCQWVLKCIVSVTEWLIMQKILQSYRKVAVSASSFLAYGCFSLQSLEGHRSWVWWLWLHKLGLRNLWRWPGTPEDKVMLPHWDGGGWISFTTWGASSRLFDLYLLVDCFKIFLFDGCSESMCKYSCTNSVLLFLPFMCWQGFIHLPNCASPNRS